MVEQLTDEEIDKFREVFSLYDKDGSGSISSSEIGAVFKALGKRPTRHEIAKMLNDVDENNNGEVDFPEFIVMVTRIKDETPEQQELKAAFKDFDRNANGFINASVFRELMTSFGEALTHDEVDEMLSEVEINEEGEINYDDFVDNWLKENGSSTSLEIKGGQGTMSAEN